MTETAQSEGGKASVSLRAVLDANIYVAAYLSRNPRSPNKEWFRRWRSGEFVLLVSKKFDQLGIDQPLTIGLLSHIMAEAQYIHVSPEDVQKVIVNDPDDDPILACAVVGRADYLITYDPHFDVLGGEHQGVRILDGLHFLYMVRGDIKPL